MQPHAAAVRRRGAAFGEARLGQPVGELDCAVVAQLQLVGEVLDRHGLPGPGLDRQQGLVLLGLDPGPAGRRLAEGQETAQHRPERGEPLVLVLIKRHAARSVATPD